MVADGLFDLLMMKLAQHYTSKKQTKIESKGPRFELGDFCVKLGSVMMNQTFKGILIEVKKLFLNKLKCSFQTSPYTEDTTSLNLYIQGDT